MRFRREPALWISLVNAVLMAAVTFGLPLTIEQKAAVDTVLVAIAAVLIRSRVTPVG